MYAHKFPLILVSLLALSLQACGGGDSTTSASSSSGGFSVSGTFTAQANTAIDSDLNDNLASYRSNNSFAEAQLIPNPVILGGYVNQINQGPDGRSRYSGDLSDSFRVNLRAGQVIQVFVATYDLSKNDLDLLLLDAQGNVVNSSQNQGDTETITVPSDGWYVIQVQAFLGASNYVLSIGQAISSAALQNSLQLTDDFVAGDVLVTMNSQGVFSAQAMSTLANEFGLSASGGSPDRRMLFNLTEDSSLRTQSLDPLMAGLNFKDAETKEKYATLLAVKRLRQRGDVAEAAPNYRLQAFATPNDKLYRYHWDYTMMDLPQAWDLTTGNRDVIVAVIDTGVLLQHPDLRNKLVQGYDFIKDVSTSVDGNGIDSDPNDPGDQKLSSSSFHGTHVAGTIGAETNNSAGVSGVGWNTRVMPLRVLGLGGAGAEYDIEQAIRYAAGLSNDSGTLPSQRADILNLSLGGPRISSDFQNVINEARNQGCMIVAAAGNDGKALTHYPAGLNGVISVSAVNMYRERASYSNTSSTVDVAAPGGDNTPDVNGDGVPDGIISTLGDDSQGSVRYIYSSSIGTSMATPHVAGVLALMKAVNPSLTPAQVDSLLSNGKMTEDLGDSGHDNVYGYGLLNAYQSVLAAIELNSSSAPVLSPKLSVGPSALNFGISTTRLNLNINNSGGSSLALTGVADTSGGRLSLVRNVTDENGLGTYTLTLDRSGLSVGTYSAEIIFSSTANQVSLPVIWQVTDGSSSGAGDAGYQYVLLINPDTLETVHQVTASVNNGQYSFRFDNVSAGDYIIVTGSDNNRDLLICDPGESCGAFLTLSDPSVLTVQQSLQDIQFDVGFNTDFLSSSAVSDEQVTRVMRRGYQRIVLHQIQQ